MPYARVIPIRSGKAEDCKRMIAEMLGPRKGDYEKALIGQGITEEYFWIQSGREGDFLIIYNDGDATLRERIREVRSSSSQPFDEWFREQFRTVLGIDLTHPGAGSRVEEVGSWLADDTRRDRAAAERSRGTPGVRPEPER
jgi:hypothetical protein